MTSNQAVAGSLGQKSAPSAVSSGGSFHANFLREYAKENVFDKYEILQVLGQGSMGYVAKVQVRRGRVAGSATDPKRQRGPLGFGLLAGWRHHKKGLENPSSVEETSEHVYALKTILIERVSPVFIQELENEVRLSICVCLCLCWCGHVLLTQSTTFSPPQQIDILRSMDHPHIVKAFEVYQYKKQIYLILQCCDGGDLYTRSPYSERQAANMVSSLLSAICYMHAHGIVHRDLKYENIML